MSVPAGPGEQLAASERFLHWGGGGGNVVGLLTPRAHQVRYIGRLLLDGVDGLGRRNGPIPARWDILLHRPRPAHFRDGLRVDHGQLLPHDGHGSLLRLLAILWGSPASNPPARCAVRDRR